MRLSSPSTRPLLVVPLLLCGASLAAARPTRCLVGRPCDTPSTLVSTWLDFALSDALHGQRSPQADGPKADPTPPQRTSTVRPAHAVVERDDKYFLEVEMPGVSSSSDLELEIRPSRSHPLRRELFLRATRRGRVWAPEPEQAQGADGDAASTVYEAQWLLNEDVDEAGPIQASMEDGVLLLTVSKRSPDDLRTPIAVASNHPPRQAIAPPTAADPDVIDLDQAAAAEA